MNKGMVVKRKDVLDLIRIAGYHEDERAYMRLYCETRIGRAAAREAYETGLRQKAGGMKCSCFHCKTRNEYPLGYMQGRGAA